MHFVKSKWWKNIFCLGYRFNFYNRPTQHIHVSNMWVDSIVNFIVATIFYERLSPLEAFRGVALNGSHSYNIFLIAAISFFWRMKIFISRIFCSAFFVEVQNVERQNVDFQISKIKMSTWLLAAPGRGHPGC
jgi:hypothetical protein